MAEDDQDIRELLVVLLEDAGCMVTSVSDGQQAIDAASHMAFRFAILDVVMPHVTGLVVATSLRRSWPDMRIVFHTSMDECWVRERFSDTHGYLRKPLVIEAFIDSLGHFLH